MSAPIHQVDAFTAEPFAGNPAGVCPLERPRDDDWMQAVAAEMNLSETAFLWPEREGFRLRWFTPAVEVPLCGHATLASAHVLWETGLVEPSRPCVFHTRSGTLTARRDDGWIELDFPAVAQREAALPRAVLDSLGGVAPVYTGAIDASLLEEHNYLVELASERDVRALRPDPRALRAAGVVGVLATARADSGEHDFVSRYFAPGAGIDEDPVTGSTHCVLAPYWSERLGRAELRGFQASRRGGTVGVRLAGGRVKLRGQAVTVLRGTLKV